MQWVWPSSTAYSERHAALIEFCKLLTRCWVEFGEFGHPIELAHEFQQQLLHSQQDNFNAARGSEPMPYLAGLVAASVFDQAIHDAFGNLHDIDIYQTYDASFMSRNLQII